jgi:hypothetical protein
MSEQNIRAIFVYRNTNGKRVKWRMDLDAQMNVLAEMPVEERALPAVPPQLRNNVAVVPPDMEAKKVEHIERYKKSLDERGIAYKLNENGQILITNVPQKEKDIIQFLDLAQPCPDIPGMGTLRELYQNEVNAAGGAACPACQLNAIQRKYRFILDKDVFNTNAT